ncbi:hypothetical protein EII42_12445 [Tessaracoccus sp. OH4464_COT-324]|nr:hypothetical protein EII42_12445 [Tessaracoccus sp. OH4464_COT-324]
MATDSLGWPVEVDCDDSWLDRVNSAQVGAALIRATASAREKFAELAGTTVSAREEVLAEQELLLAGLWNIAARKGHR